MQAHSNKILVVRNDKLGDFMLTWPALATLKRSLPTCEVHALVSAYTAEMARLCPDIDQVIVDPGADAGAGAQLAFARALRLQKFDAAITLYSTTRIGLLLLLARIPYRLAPATKIAQLFYHRRLRQRRSQSLQPEHAYNRDLVLQYLRDQAVTAAGEPAPPLLRFDAGELATLRREFCAHAIADSRQLVFIHPGSGGSANNLSLSQYAQLARALTSRAGHHLVISAGPAERAQAQALGEMLHDVPHTVYVSTAGLQRFARHLALAAVFISGSTGPLHIAGALDRPTAAFYPRRRSATALRWQTTNSADRRLAFSPPGNAAEDDMASIDLAAAAAEISRRFLLGG